MLGKGVAIALSAVPGVAALCFLWLYVTFAERGNIRPGTPASYLLIHQSLRSIEPIDQCAPLTFSRYFQECGGTCGEQQNVEFGTTATLADLNAAYDLDAIGNAMEVDEVDMILVSDPTLPEGCLSAVIRTYDPID